MRIISTRDQLESAIAAHLQEIKTALTFNREELRSQRTERQTSLVEMMALYGMGRYLEDQKEKTGDHRTND